MSLTVHTGVPPDTPFTADEARHITDQLREHLEEDYQLIVDAYQRRAWAALGYRTWDEYLDVEFGDIRLKLPQEDRQAAVLSLHEAGLSNRAQAAVLGVDEKTVRNDLAALPAGAENSAPAPNEDEVVDAEIVDEEPAPRQVTGTDGKTYKINPKPVDPKPKRTPLGDLAKDAGWELRRTVEKLERIFDDDRFRANRDILALHLRPHLDHAASTCQTLLDELT